MAKEIKIRLKYQRELYVERQSELAEATGWLTKDRRLLTVTANPATGKSWFLRRMEEAFAAQEDVETIWIDTKELLPERGANRPPHISPLQMGQWIKNFTDNLRQQCELVPTDLEVAHDILLEKIAESLVHCWPEQKICIFVDGGDELSDGGWRDFERQILGPLASESQIHFIIALRSKQRVQLIPLRISEKRIHLEVWSKLNDEINDETSAQGNIQLQLLLDRLGPDTAVILKKLLRDFPEYDKTHPGLNAFFYQLVNQGLADNIDSLVLCKIALRAINPAIKDSDLDNVVSLLLGIADFEDTWSIEDVQQWLGISNSQAFEHVETLKSLYLVTHLSSGKHKIPDGLRSFVRGVLHVVSPVTIQTGEILSAEARPQFIKKLANSLQEDPREIYDLGTGQLSLDMPAETANKLKRRFESGDLTGLDITHVEFSARRSQLRVLIGKHFNRDELEVLCFDLNLEFDELGTQAFSVAVIRLIQYCERHGRLKNLVDQCKARYPHVNWPE
jgi:hypothetical protein